MEIGVVTITAALTHADQLVCVLVPSMTQAAEVIKSFQGHLQLVTDYVFHYKIRTKTKNQKKPDVCGYHGSKLTFITAEQPQSCAPVQQVRESACFLSTCGAAVLREKHSRWICVVDLQQKHAASNQCERTCIHGPASTPSLWVHSQSVGSPR